MGDTYESENDRRDKHKNDRKPASTGVSWCSGTLYQTDRTDNREDTFEVVDLFVSVSASVNVAIYGMTYLHDRRGDHQARQQPSGKDRPA